MSRCAWANSFHGSLFEFNENSAFYSRNFFYPIVPPVRCAARTNRAEQASKTTTFSAPVGLTFGSVGASVVRGPGFMNLDTSICRRSRVREGISSDPRFETFNTTKYTAFRQSGNDADV